MWNKHNDTHIYTTGLFSFHQPNSQCFDQSEAVVEGQVTTQWSWSCSRAVGKQVSYHTTSTAPFYVVLNNFHVSQIENAYRVHPLHVCKKVKHTVNIFYIFKQLQFSFHKYFIVMLCEIKQYIGNISSQTLKNLHITSSN